MSSKEIIIEITKAHEIIKSGFEEAGKHFGLLEEVHDEVSESLTKLTSLMDELEAIERKSERNEEKFGPKTELKRTASESRIERPKPESGSKAKTTDDVGKELSVGFKGELEARAAYKKAKEDALEFIDKGLNISTGWRSRLRDNPNVEDNLENLKKMIKGIKDVPNLNKFIEDAILTVKDGCKEGINFTLESEAAAIRESIAKLGQPENE